MTQIVQWSPFRELDRFFDDSSVFGGNGFLPAMDVYQEGENVVVQMTLPNIDADKVNVHVENDVLTVSGETSEKEEVKRENYYRKEIREGSFSRSIVLPMKVKGDEAAADYAKGVLTITLPKAEEAKPKKIAINVSGK